MNNNWIFLRGLTRGAIHWGNFPEVFLSINPEAKTEYIEIPGNGKRNKEETPLSVEEIIFDLRNNSDFVKRRSGYRLVGISLGGMIALKWAELFPDEVLSVHIINSSFREISSPFERFNVKALPVVLKGMLACPKKKEQLILSLTSNRPDNSLHLQNFSEFSAEYPLKWQNFFRQLLLAGAISLPDKPMPKLQIICSLGDQLVSPDCSYKLAEKMNVLVTTHPSAGHDLPLDEPEWLAGKLLLAEKVPQ